MIYWIQLNPEIYPELYPNNTIRFRYYPKSEFKFIYYKTDQIQIPKQHDLAKLGFTKYKTLLEVFLFCTNCTTKIPTNLENAFQITDSKGVVHVIERPYLHLPTLPGLPN
jgi:hypothetical protein